MWKIRWIAVLLSLFFLGARAESLEKWVDQPAPEFELAMVSGNGKLSLKDYRGKVVLLDFWASWCAPCKKSLPELQNLEAKYENLQVVAINIDDNRQNARRFMKKQALDLTVVFDAKKSVAKTYDISEMPSAILIDRNGVIRHVISGYTKNQIKELEIVIDELIHNRRPAVSK